jgi:hypothetical protein
MEDLEHDVNWSQKQLYEAKRTQRRDLQRGLGLYALRRERRGNEDGMRRKLAALHLAAEHNATCGWVPCTNHVSFRPTP